MFVRKVSVRLKPDSLREFASLMECEILPWLRKQEGFLDLITLVSPDAIEVATLSFWDHETNAHAFDASGYPAALTILQELLDGIPYVKTFDVVGSTLPQFAPLRPDHADTLVQDTGSAQLGYRTYETNV